jgi:hypothetical protein
MEEKIGTGSKLMKMLWNMLKQKIGFNRAEINKRRL